MQDGKIFFHNLCCVVCMQEGKFYNVRTSQKLSLYGSLFYNHFSNRKRISYPTWSGAIDPIFADGKYIFETEKYVLFSISDVYQFYSPLKRASMVE